MHRLQSRLGLLAVAALAAATSAALPAAAQEALPVVAPVRSCAALADIDLTGIGGAGSAVTSAAETSEGGIAACTVEGTLAPAIRFQVTLPTTTWTQRYLQIGCGGLCGEVEAQPAAVDGCAVLEAGGFVTASTDMGHEGPDPSFGLDPQKREDFAFRAQHLTAEVGKALIAAYYDQPQRYAYFSGCSDGGREALIEAQRFPEDFDGIVAGAPAMLFTVQNSLYHGFMARANTGEGGKPVLTADRLPLLHAAVVAACDKIDGQTDGLIANPRACSFDPATIACAEGAADTSACLTAAEVATVRKFYQGPRDPDTGERLTVGGPQPGSELGWAGVFVPRAEDPGIFSEVIAMGALKNLVFEDTPAESYTLADLQFDKATFDRLRPRHPLFDATNPDLSAFADRGGKLVLWHGWADEHITPLGTIAYQHALESEMGKDAVAGFERLYLVPGMAHCKGGEGPHQTDLLTPVMAWVEQGIAPDAVVASAPDRSRPVFPWPAVARHDGKGDPAEAASYARAEDPLVSEPVSEWVGQDFFRPY
jgi:hypothetical protein